MKHVPLKKKIAKNFQARTLDKLINQIRITKVINNNVNNVKKCYL